MRSRRIIQALSCSGTHLCKSSPVSQEKQWVPQLLRSPFRAEVLNELTQLKPNITWSGRSCLSASRHCGCSGCRREGRDRFWFTTYSDIAHRSVSLLLPRAWKRDDGLLHKGSRGRCFQSRHCSAGEAISTRVPQARAIVLGPRPAKLL